MKLRILSTFTAFLIITTVASAQPRRSGGRGATKNPNGGVTAGSDYGGSGTKGKFERSAGVTSDGLGNATSGSQAKFSGANGSKGGYSRKANVNADGSATSSGSGSASGAKGSVDTAGTTTRNSDGTVNANRATNASSDKGTYSGSTTYATGSGAQRTSTCKDASGNVIPCPTKSK